MGMPGQLQRKDSGIDSSILHDWTAIVNDSRGIEQKLMSVEQI